jgi:type IV secretory pathway VirB2 component (pilin)
LLGFAALLLDRFLLQGEPMAEPKAKWLTFYAENVEPVYKEMVSHIEKLIIGTLIVSAGVHVSSEEPSIQLFGYLRHSLVGRGVMLVGVIVLALNFIDGLYKLAKVNWHVAWQIVMSISYIALSVRLIQLILAFRGSE